jgi:amphi-Trp domain-containing protein
MTEIEWESKIGREQAAALLRRLADGLAAGSEVKLEHEGFELKVATADEVEMEIEVELEDGRTEVELELRWETGGSSRTESEDAVGPESSAHGARAGARGEGELDEASAGSVD